MIRGDAEPLLRIERLSRRFGPRKVLTNFDLMLGHGKRAALCGPNGVGKTTVLRCVAGTLAPTSGRIAVGGHLAGSIQARRQIGASFSQERSFYLRLSGRENLLVFARVRGLTRRDAVDRVRQLEDELELEEILAERVDRCSTGMVQQLAVARALLDDPELLVLDEPTRSLDDEATARLWAALDRRPAAALLMATHRDDDIARCHQRIELGS
jgi:ABC-2 type transport system ATP-binding protein